MGPLDAERVAPGDKPISHITRVLAAAGTSYPVVLARPARASQSSVDRQIDEVNKEFQKLSKEGLIDPGQSLKKLKFFKI